MIDEKIFEDSRFPYRRICAAVDLDALAQNCTEAEYRRLEDIFVTCSRYELGFWEMAWRLAG